MIKDSCLDNVIICKKGIVDLISDGNISYYVAMEGSLKRCGGQGDVLAGIVGSFAKFASNLNDVESISERKILSVVCASIATRSSAHKAFL
jgi:ATP-dependent NAD(P)H-hydrate dehydratase